MRSPISGSGPRDRRGARLLAAFLAPAVLSATASFAQPQALEPVTLARYPGPTFLENLAVGPDGAVHVTNYSGRTIETLSPEGRGRVLAVLDAHPVSLVADADGFTVVVHGVSFTQGQRFVGTGRLLRLDRSGAVLSDRPLDGVLFANGILAVPGGYLIADSIGARIVRVDAATGVVSTFHADPILAPQTDPYFLPGANGLKRVGDALVGVTT